MSEKPRIHDQYTGSFLDYERILLPANETSPQRQGLNADEYAVAIEDPRVVSTVISEEDKKEILLPQLVPVEDYPWLNTEEYKRRFPEAMQLDAVRHFIDFPGIDPGDDVKVALRELAKKEGVLVFDFPDSDEGYIGRVQLLLSELGVNHGEVIELGTQAYFGGKVKLKQGYDPNKPIRGLHDAFQSMIAMGIIKPEQIVNGASYAQNITPQEAARLYPVYREAFQALNQHPCRQGLEPEEFVDVTTREPETAKLLYNVDGETATVMVLGDDLSKYEWINPAFYKRTYPQEYEQRQILYFPALYTDPERQGDVKSQYVVNLIAQMVEFGNNEIIVAFDCCDINIGFLDKYIEGLVNQTPEANLYFDRLGTQRYAAIQLSNKQD